MKQRGSGVPLEGATLQVDDRTVVADGRGAFTIELPAGAHTLVVSHPDHVTTSFDEELAEDEVVEVTYRLDRRSWRQELTVYGEERREEVSRSVLSVDELRIVPGNFGDPIRALQSLPGVARPNGLEGELVVRGAEGFNTRAYIDDIPVPYLFHWFVARSVVNTALIDDIEFYPGGMPTRFGNVTQSVINARTQLGTPKPGVHGRVSFDLFDTAASTEGSAGDFTWEVGGRYSWIGGLIAATARVVAASRGIPQEEASWVYPRYWDYTGHLRWQRGDHRLVFTALGARDAFILRPGKIDLDGDGDLDDPIPSGLPFDPNRLLDSHYHRYRLRWDVIDGGREQSTWLAVGPDREQSLLPGLGLLSSGPELGRIRGTDVIALRDDRVPLGGDDALRTGGMAWVRPVETRNFQDVATLLLDRATSTDLQQRYAVWGEYQRWQTGTWIAPGLRSSYFHFNNQEHVELEPRLSVRRPWKNDERFTTTAFVGRFAQIPPADTYTEALGNPQLTLMKAWQTSVGLEGRWPGGLELDVTAYATAMTDLVIEDEEVRLNDQPDRALVESPYATSSLVPVFRNVRGYAFGGEILLRARPNDDWFGWIGFSASRALRLEEGDLLTGDVFPSDYDQPLALTLVGARTFPRSWRLAGRVRLTSGQPFTPLQATYDPQADLWQGLKGELNSERFPLFRQLDVRLDKTWTAKRARWTFYVDIHNVSNARNFLLVTYTPNFAELAPIVWIPILPTAGIEVSY